MGILTYNTDVRDASINETANTKTDSQPYEGGGTSATTQLIQMAQLVGH